MKVTGLDGRLHAWRPKGTRGIGRLCSSNHLRARQLLIKLFPNEQRLEEVGLPGTGGMMADFYLPGLRLMVEAHGEQHYEQTPFFHDSHLDFLRGQVMDNNKAKWCALNGINYVELPHYEDDNAWRNRLVGRGEGTEAG